jgi:hypothetical protein
MLGRGGGSIATAHTGPCHQIQFTFLKYKIKI